MILAIGNVSLKPLLSAMHQMALDLSSDHELNHVARGNWRHEDGWGISYLSKGKWKTIRSTNAFYNDPKVEKLKDIQTSLVLIHTRKKWGSETHIKNTHPFHAKSRSMGEVYFCHNGYVDGAITFDPRYVPKGKTDSEQLFYSILSHGLTADMLDAVSASLRHGQGRGNNIIITSKNASIVGCSDTLYKNYYGMKLGQGKDLIVISSEHIPSLTVLSWQQIPSKVAIHIDHKSLQITQQRL